MKEHASIKKQENEDIGSNQGRQFGKRTMLGEAIERTKPYTCDSQLWKVITESVTCFMAKEMIPINIVEKPEFLAW